MTDRPRISLIAAMGRDRTIGKDNQIPWHIPEDMKHLRDVTRGKPLIMGRHTYESIHALRGTDPQTTHALPGRLNIVLTSNRNYFRELPPQGVLLAQTPQDGLNAAINYAKQHDIDEIFIFGGETVYRALIDQAERLYLTVIDHNYAGDSFFPEIDEREWHLVSENIIPAKDENPAVSFKIYTH